MRKTARGPQTSAWEVFLKNLKKKLRCEFDLHSSYATQHKKLKTYKKNINKKKPMSYIPKKGMYVLDRF